MPTEDEPLGLKVTTGPDGTKTFTLVNLFDPILTAQDAQEYMRHMEHHPLSSLAARLVEVWSRAGAYGQAHLRAILKAASRAATDGKVHSADLLRIAQCVPDPALDTMAGSRRIVNTIKDVTLTVNEVLHGQRVTRWLGVIIDGHQRWRWQNPGGNEASGGVLVNVATGEQARLLYEDETFYLGTINSPRNHGRE